MVKNLPAMQETWVQSLVREDCLGKGMATHCSVLAWRIPWTEEPGGLQSVGSQRAGHDWTKIHTPSHLVDHSNHNKLKMSNYMNNNNSYLASALWLFCCSWVPIMRGKAEGTSGDKSQLRHFSYGNNMMKNVYPGIDSTQSNILSVLRLA